MTEIALQITKQVYGPNVEVVTSLQIVIPISDDVLSSKLKKSITNLIMR